MLHSLGLLEVSQVAAWGADVLVAVVVDVVDSGHVVCVVMMDDVVLDVNAVDVVMVTIHVVQDDTIVHDVVVVVAHFLCALRIVLIAASLHSWIVVLEGAILRNWWQLSAWLSTWLSAWLSAWRNWASSNWTT
jgi:hypothetical protein